MKQHRINIFNHEVTFVFDDAVVSLETVVRNLEDEGFPLEGTPQFLDAF